MRKRGRITVQSQPTGGERMMMRGMGILQTIVGFVFVVMSITEIIPANGLFGLVFLAAGLFSVINGIRLAVSKNDISHRVGYDVETDLERSIVGLTEEVPDTTAEPLTPPVTSVEQRMESLKNLYDRQLITTEEFEQKRQEILREL